MGEVPKRFVGILHKSIEPIHGHTFHSYYSLIVWIDSQKSELIKMKVVVAIPLLLTALSKRSAVAQLISPGVPTYSPVNLPPENPGYPSCYVCGPGKVVTIANGVVTPSDKPPTVCGIFQQAGLLGYVDPDLCPMMLDLTENCGCEVGTIAPTVSPSSTPSVIAVIYDPVVAVTMESPSESLGLFTKWVLS